MAKKPTSKSFSMVTRTIWRSKRFRALDDLHRLLMLYFITSPHQTGIGCFTVPVEYACSDLGWPQTIYEPTRDELAEAGLILVSGDGETIFITDWFNHCPPTNASHATGLERLIDEIADETVRDVVYDAYTDATAKRSAEPSRTPERSLSYLNNTNVMRRVS